MKDINELLRNYEKIEDSRYNDKLEREEYDELLKEQEENMEEVERCSRHLIKRL